MRSRLKVEGESHEEPDKGEGVELGAEGKQHPTHYQKAVRGHVGQVAALYRIKDQKS